MSNFHQLRPSSMSNLIQTFEYVEFLWVSPGYAIKAGKNGLYSRR